MHTNQKGFSALQILLLIGVVVFTGFSCWYVLQHQKSNTNTTSVPKTTSSATKPTVVSAISLTQSKLPDGWTVERTDSNYLLLSNKATNCSTEASYTTDTAESNSPTIDQNQQTIDAIKSKGYTVEDSTTTLTIHAKAQDKQLPAHLLTITGLDNPMFQEYAYVSTTESLTRIQLSCPTKSDLASAESALSAITFTKL